MSRLIDMPPFRAGNASVQISESREEAGKAAAEKAAVLLQEAIRRRGHARLIAATGNSQLPLIEALVQLPIEWGLIDVFHMDEYAEMPAVHPASFRRWIKEHISDRVHPRNTYYLQGDASDLDAEMSRYAELLHQAPVDLAFVGFGENGHIAFNDPPTAEFDDARTVKRVVLDQACRQQQAGEGHFKDLESVPLEAVTITCSGLFRAQAWVSSVPEQRKATAVRNALEGPIAESCPASLVQRHPNAQVFLDRDSASSLSIAMKARRE